ncbi:MAG: tetratricopeptide repeat protein [Gammaproteobacteria bacterium]
MWQRFAKETHPYAARLIRAAWLATTAMVLQACATSGSLTSDNGTDPDAGEDVIPADALTSYERALSAMDEGDLVEAELELEHLILEYRDYAGPYVNLAILYRENERFEDAEEVLQLALDLHPEHPAANNQLGILRRSQGRFADAEAAYERAIAADPDYALAYMNLGILLDVYLRRPADALENYESYQALLTEPDRAVAGWIVDLRRRLDVPAEPQRVAQEVSR